MAETQTQTEKYDVIIVGAGFSGLAAAKDLQKQNKKVLIVEARDRVGGRSYTTDVLLDDGKTKRTVDFGAMWIGPQQTRMKKLVDEYGVRFYPTYYEGTHLNYFEGERLKYDGESMGLGIFSLLSIARYMKKCAYMASSIDPAAPWEHEKALKYDCQSVASMTKTMSWTNRTRSIVESFVKAYACEHDEMSFLYFLTVMQSAGGLDAFVDGEGGPEEWLFEGGSMQIVEIMAKDIGQENIKLSHPVTNIEYTSDSAKVTCKNGNSFSGKRCIVAIPPILCQKINFSPRLPVIRNQFHERVPMGSVIKCHLIYAKAWWREAEFSGQLTSDEGPLSYVIDQSFPDDWKAEEKGKNQTSPALVAFIIGKDVIEWGQKTKQERRSAICSQLEMRFKMKEAGNLIGYAELNWCEEEYTGGCYGGYMAPGVITKYAKTMRVPVKSLHWASTELAISWCGYMEGAVESGQRAAAEVLEQLNK